MSMQVEALALAVAKRAREIDGVEVARAGQDGLLLRITAVDLRGLDDLQACLPSGSGDPERSAAGVSLRSHHRADAERTVELPAREGELHRGIGRTDALRGRHVELGGQDAERACDRAQAARLALEILERREHAALK